MTPREVLGCSSVEDPAHVSSALPNCLIQRMRKDESDMPTVLPERRFHDFAVGDALQSRARTVTEADIVGQLYHDEETMNQPLRIDDRHARLPEGPGRGVQPSAGIAGRVQ